MIVKYEVRKGGNIFKKCCGSLTANTPMALALAFLFIF